MELTTHQVKLAAMDPELSTNVMTQLKKNSRYKYILKRVDVAQDNKTVYDKESKRCDILTGGNILKESWSIKISPKVLHCDNE